MDGALLVIAWMNGRYVMPEVGAYDMASFCEEAMRNAVALDMTLAMDLMVE